MTTARPTATTPTRVSGVGSGSRTVDEMAHAWVDVTYLEKADYEAVLERRKALTDNDE